MKAKTTNIIKRIVDVVMTLLLLCLMAYQVTGEALHEWFGVAMTVILIVHHILNYKWYKTLFKGKYNAYPVITVIVNTLLLASIGLTAFCGMSMSGHRYLSSTEWRAFHLCEDFILQCPSGRLS